MANLKIGEIDLYYESHGNGQPLLLVAGLASDSQSWQTVLVELAAHYRVIAPDNRGVGRTRPQDTVLSIGGMADDCAALLRYLELESVHLLGHSMGGFVVLDLAMRYPQLVHRLVLVGTSWSNSPRNNALFSDWARELAGGKDPAAWFRNIFYWIFTARFFEDPAALQAAEQYALDYPYPQCAHGFAAQVRALADYDGAQGLPRIGTRTQVIAGEEDLLFPPELGARLARAIPGAAFTAIEGAAHSVHVEQPGAFCRVVLDFLRDD